MSNSNQKWCLLAVGMAVALALNGLALSRPVQAQGKLVPITIKPISDTYAVINSLRLQFDISQDGKSVGGKGVKGNMFAKVVVDNAKESRRTTIGGSLLTQQMDGATPNTQITLLNVVNDTYLLVESDKTTCVKTTADGGTDSLTNLTESFDTVVSDLVETLSAEASTPIATFMGEEIVSGIAVKRYGVDSTSAVGKSLLEGLNENGDQIKQARVDLWTAVEGDYLVKLEMKLTGKTAMLGDPVDGKLSFSFSYSDINKKVDVTLPKSCQSAAAAPAAAPQASAPDAEAIGSYKDVKQATVRLVASGTFWELGTDEAVTDGWSGSGFIIDPSGLAMTNNHVVLGADSLQAYVGGEVIPRNVKVIARNECADVALIKISGRNFPFLAWEESEVEAGLDVYAAGFPLGDPEFTLTRGIVSKAKANGNTAISGIEYRIEHDATINPGSSGGPLVTVDGRVVGVNAAQNKDARQSFAAPAALVLERLDDLKAGNDVSAIGILPRAVLSQFASGIWVNSVEAGSLAAEAGVQPGDVITNLNGEAVVEEETLEIFCRVLREKAGEPMPFEVTRLATSEALAGELGGEALRVSGQVEAGNQGGNDNANDEAISIEIVNDSDVAVAKVYITSPEADDWGENLLEGDPIEPGDRLALTVRKGVYDFKPADADDESLGALYRLDVDEGSELVVTGIAGLPSGAKKAFEEKFDRLRKEVWTPAKADDTEMKMSGGEYCMAVNKAGWSIWDMAKTTFSKSFSAEVLCSVDPAGGLCALGFGADLDNHYWMSLTPETQTVSVFEKRKGVWVETPVIAATQSAAIKPSGANFLGIDRLNGKLFVYANGRLLGEASASKFSAPRMLVGGGTHEGGDSAKACMDEFTVWNVK